MAWLITSEAPWFSGGWERYKGPYNPSPKAHRVGLLKVTLGFKQPNPSMGVHIATIVFVGIIIIQIGSQGYSFDGGLNPRGKFVWWDMA